MSTCCPARCPGQSGTSRRSVAVLGVSRTVSVTVPTCHCTGSVAPVALLAPGIAVVVVADALPEAGLVVHAEAQPPHPLGALPEVEVRDQEAGGASVLGLEVLPVVADRHPRLAARDVLEGQVGRV